jgi:hypothetical protein
MVAANKINLPYGNIVASVREKTMQSNAKALRPMQESGFT